MSSIWRSTEKDPHDLTNNRERRGKNKMFRKHCRPQEQKVIAIKSSDGRGNIPFPAEINVLSLSQHLILLFYKSREKREDTSCRGRAYPRSPQFISNHEKVKIATHYFRPGMGEGPKKEKKNT